MEQQILDAIEELGGDNKEFIFDYLDWADSIGNCTLQLDRPLVRLFRGNAQVATLHLETALLTVHTTDA